MNDSDSDSDSGNPIIVTRKQWEARKPKKVTPMTGTVTDVVYTETDTRECTSREDCTRLIQEIQRYHMDVRGLQDIQHHFLVGSDGAVYEGRGWKAMGHHYSQTTRMPKDLVGRSIEVVFIGSFKEKEPSQKMIKASGALLKYGVNNNLLSIVSRKVKEEKVEMKNKKKKREERQLTEEEIKEIEKELESRTINLPDDFKFPE